MNKILPYLEKAFLLALLVGLLLKYFNIGNEEIIIVSLSGLALSFFLFAFQPTDINPLKDDDNQELLGFNDLLGTSILPKTLGIGSSVGIIGILFYNLDLENNGYKEMLSVGGTTIILTALLFAYLKIAGTKNLEKPILGLLKSLPILIAIGYIFFTVN